MTTLKCLTILFAEFAIMILGIVAIDHGVDGAIFVTCVGTIAGLGGYTIKKAGDNSFDQNK